MQLKRQGGVEAGRKKEIVAFYGGLFENGVGVFIMRANDFVINIK